MPAFIERTQKIVPRNAKEDLYVKNEITEKLILPLMYQKGEQSWAGWAKKEIRHTISDIQKDCHLRGGRVNWLKGWQRHGGLTQRVMSLIQPKVHFKICICIWVS